jgi:hypothetical protein
MKVRKIRSAEYINEKRKREYDQKKEEKKIPE